MSGPIVRLRGEQFDAAMQFLDRSFTKDEPMDFAGMLPSIYQRDDAAMQNNYAIVEGGEIAAVVGLFPLKLQMGDVQLRLAGVGGVSTAPEKRGQGLMTRLMSYVRDEIVRHGYDLSYLGGDRQRYRRFGWEKAGSELRIVLGKTARATVQEPVVFDEAPGDTGTLSRIKELHDARDVHCVREAPVFSRYLACWHRRWWAAKDGDRVVGYLVADKNGAYVPEIVAEDDEALVRMALAWNLRSDKPVTLVLPASPTRALGILSELAESIDHQASGNWQVFNWPKVLDSMLRLGHKTSPLLPGEVVIGLPDGQKLHLEVRGNGAGCSSGSEGAADVTCEPMQLVRALFGPGPARLALGATPKVQLLDSWCPLRLAISEQDKV
jgi:predicted N-acetyltransferase YhbS